MPPLFAAAPAIVPCLSASPLTCRCCRRHRRWGRWRGTHPTDHHHPPPLPFRRRASFCCCAVLLAGFCCRAVLRSGSQLLTPPLLSPSPMTPTMSSPVLSDVFLLRDCAAGFRCRQPIIVATKLSLPLPPPISLLSLSCLLQPSFLAIAIAAAVSCLRQTPSSSLVSLLIVAL